MPKIQAQKIPSRTIFETDTPKGAKAKLGAAVPHGATLLIGNTWREYQEMRIGSRATAWIHKPPGALAIHRRQPRT